MRNFSPTLKRLLLTTLCCGACWGCGAAGGGAQTALVPVTGKVTYKGQPVAKGRIRFEPDGYGRPAFGQLKSDGTYMLTTEKDGDGVIAGHHRVTVTDTGIKSPKDALANKWRSEAASGLTADVDAEHNEFTFDLN
jgi:hypothetical protein